jgi:hypothetical protein
VVRPSAGSNDRSVVKSLSGVYYLSTLLTRSLRFHFDI